MEILNSVFNERLAEIDDYLNLLGAIEEQVRSGPPTVGSGGPVISTSQQRILYSSVYLQLYNLVEATITKCVEALCEAVSKDGVWKPSDLTPSLRKEWVRYLTKTHTDLNFENRLTLSLTLCEHLINAFPVKEINIEKGGGGNWDEKKIRSLADRLGCVLSITGETYTAVKRHVREERDTLELIVKLRNDLAHGAVSFGECGSGVTVNELRELKTRASEYMKEVVQSFGDFIESHRYLQEASRPAEVGA